MPAARSARRSSLSRSSCQHGLPACQCWTICMPASVSVGPPAASVAGILNPDGTAKRTATLWMAAAIFGNISPAKLEDGLADCLQLHSYTALRRRTLHNFTGVFAQHAIVCATLPSHPPTMTDSSPLRACHRPILQALDFASKTLDFESVCTCPHPTTMNTVQEMQQAWQL